LPNEIDGVIGDSQNGIIDRLALIDITTPIAGDGVIDPTEAGALVISGTTTNVDEGQIVTVTLDDGVTSASWTAVVESDGSWTLAASPADIVAAGLSIGQITVTAEVEDIAGNVANDTEIATYSDAPLIKGMSNDYASQPAGHATPEDHSVISGVGAVGATIELYDESSNLLGSGVVDSFGIWEIDIDLSGLAVGGSLTVTAVQIDNAVISAPSEDFIITRTSPSVSTLDADIIVDGGWESTFAVQSAIGAGDVNNDGYDDFIVTRNSGVGAQSEAYLIFGKDGDGWGSFDPDSNQWTIDGNNLAFADGFVVTGMNFSEISAVGDVNGDDIDDFLVGTGGTKYVILGKDGSGWLTSTDGNGREVLDLANLDPSDGFVVDVHTDFFLDFSTLTFAALGDINGDGHDDFAVDGGGNSYVIYGKDVALDGAFGSSVNNQQVLNASALSASEGFVITGAGGGYQTTLAGDINHDGYDDLLVGAAIANSSQGAAYVIYGNQAGTFGGFDAISGQQVLDLSALTPSEGFVIQDSQASSQNGRSLLGWSVSSLGDINGDGFDDIIVSSQINWDSMNVGQAPAGIDRSYVLFGKDGGTFGDVNGVLDLNTLAPNEGFVIQGNPIGDMAGYSVSGIGDYNGDGLADMIISAPLDGLGTAGFGLINQPDDPAANIPVGAFYVVYGKDYDTQDTNEVNPFGSLDGGSGLQTLDLASLTDLDGFVIHGVNGAVQGYSVGIAGDVNHDGKMDFIVTELGAYVPDIQQSDYTTAVHSKAYIFFGGGAGLNDDLSSITRFGTASDDWLIGSDVNDVLNGAGGADVILAYGGDDTIAVTDANFARIDGGDGFDTLALSSSGITLDFSLLNSGAVTGIEKIDINGTGSNVLNLTLQDVLDATDSTNHQLILAGGGDDTVNLTGFSAEGTQVFEGVTYNLYQDAGRLASLLIEQTMGTVTAV
jgi:hypothetical protein